ncbi:MAG: carbohydrate ABC transporter permease [Bacillota bacterium]
MIGIGGANGPGNASGSGGAGGAGGASGISGVSAVGARAEASRRGGPHAMRILGRVLTYALVTAGAVATATPFVWLILSSFKSLQEVVLFPPTFLPKRPVLSNFVEVFRMIPFGRYYLNSVITSVIPTAATVLTSSMTGMGFAKYRFAGRSLLFWIILSTMMVPFPATIVPLYVMVSRAGLVNTYAGLIVVGLSSAFGIFMMRQFIMSIPDELLDAARIDGAGEFRIFLQIVMPLTKPAVATLTLFTFTGHWGAYIWPLIVVNSDRLRTLPLAIPYFSGQYLSFQNLINAASLMAIAPVLVLFLFTQRYFVQGITLTGLKT